MQICDVLRHHIDNLTFELISLYLLFLSFQSGYKVFITRCCLQLANCFCHSGKILIFKVNGLMIAQNDAGNKVCVVDAAVFGLFPPPPFFFFCKVSL